MNSKKTEKTDWRTPEVRKACAEVVRACGTVSTKMVRAFKAMLPSIREALTDIDEERERRAVARRMLVYAVTNGGKVRFPESLATYRASMVWYAVSDEGAGFATMGELRELHKKAKAAKVPPTAPNAPTEERKCRLPQGPPIQEAGAWHEQTAHALGCVISGELENAHRLGVPKLKLLEFADTELRTAIKTAFAAVVANK